MITPADSFNTIEIDGYYAICPDNTLYQGLGVEDYRKHHKGEMVPVGFSYTSGANSEWLSVDDLRSQIQEHVDPTFEVKKIGIAA